MYIFDETENEMNIMVKETNERPVVIIHTGTSPVKVTIERNKVFITNLGKCTQIDARPLLDDVLKQYLDLLFEEIDIIKPKVIVTFGNQVSSIILNEKISVSENRKISHNLKIKEDTYKVFPVYYPVGNGIFNIDKSIEDIKWIIKNIERS